MSSFPLLNQCVTVQTTDIEVVDLLTKYCVTKAPHITVFINISYSEIIINVEHNANIKY